MTRIVVISDTHGEEHNVKIPKCDIFIHCGDSYIDSFTRLNVINNWLGTIDANHRIIIAGNHDGYLQEIGKSRCERLFTNATYLQDKEITIEGLKIYGSPWTPLFNNWAFMLYRKSKELKNIWKKIPENLDLLITHGPAYQILDKNLHNESCGCEILKKEIFKKKPKIHLFGHIHGEYGHCDVKGINFCNCSVLNEQYELTNKPIIIEI